MLASASRSACRPAPLVGSVAAKVRTAGREGTGSFIRKTRGRWGITLETRLALRAPTGGRYDAWGARASSHSTQPLPRSPMSSPAPVALPYKMWRCLACGLVYDEAEGWPDDGIAPGTRWEDIPAGWCCPECGARKDDFEMVEF